MSSQSFGRRRFQNKLEAGTPTQLSTVAHQELPPRSLVPPKPPIGHRIAGVVVAGLLLLGLATCVMHALTPNNQDMLFIRFSESCEDQFKRTLNYPASYNREFRGGWGPEERGGVIAMQTFFTGTNAFGVPERFLGDCVLKDGRITASVSQAL
jgi:hypothetical protein